MGKYNVAYSSRIIDIEDYDLPKQLCYRPLQDEYIHAIKKSDNEQKIFKICKIVHTVNYLQEVLVLHLSF